MAQRSRGPAAGPRPAGRTGARADRVAARDDARQRVSTPGGPDLRALRPRLVAAVEPLVHRAGLDLEDLRVTRAGRRYVVQVVVDGDGGVDHDELSKLSRQISTDLDEAEASGTPGGLRELRAVNSYTLEVSSPGVDRPLTLPRHWRRNVGRLVLVKAGDRLLTGRIVASSEVEVTLEVGGRAQTLPFTVLGPGRVQIEFNRLAELVDEDFGAEIADEDEDDKEYRNEDHGGGVEARGTDQRQEGEDGA
jgi:ribosome maturation factor RimP